MRLDPGNAAYKLALVQTVPVSRDQFRRGRRSIWGTLSQPGVEPLHSQGPKLDILAIRVQMKWLHPGTGYPGIVVFLRTGVMGPPDAFVPEL
eukprot:1798372-Rhodomonas_salina.2